MWKRFKRWFDDSKNEGWSVPLITICILLVICIAVAVLVWAEIQFSRNTSWLESFWSHEIVHQEGEYGSVKFQLLSNSNQRLADLPIQICSTTDVSDGSHGCAWFIQESDHYGYVRYFDVYWAGALEVQPVVEYQNCELVMGPVNPWSSYPTVKLTVQRVDQPDKPVTSAEECRR